ncbi:MAG: DUF2892 domain-containing protein [Desulfobulbaceae bacterium]|nr:MAG: DUF2892 domain-containing protein [Desulfobulbaceae bacterium]
MGTMKMISPQDADSLVKQGKGQLVDIRSVGEILAEQIPGSVTLPFDLVNKTQMAAAGLGEKTPILVCRSGNRAEMAAKSLARETDDVAVLDGGIVQWKRDGFNVAEGRNALPLERQVLVTAGSMILLFSVLGFLVSPLFFGLTIAMSGGMIFAGATGACGMARVLMLLPWNKAPLCNAGSCAVEGG